MWAVLWWLFLYVALPVGLGYLGGVLLAGDEPEAEENIEGAQSRQWKPRTTKAEGLPRPRAYGTNMHHGNIVTNWTDVDGDDREILYAIIDHGEGPTEGMGANIVYINDQPAGNFGAVVIQERLGTMDQTVMTGFEQTKIEYSLNTELVYGAAVTTFTTPNDFFDNLEYTLAFPNGLITYRKDGSSDGVGTTIMVRVRPVAGGWTTIFNGQITGETLEPKYVKFLVSDYMAITKGTQYEIEFSRTVADESERSRQNVYVRSVREVVDTAFTHPGRALIGIKAVATTRLSGSMDVKVIRKDRIVGVYDGTSWSLEWSDNRAWVVWDLLTQPVISGNGGGTPYAIERYEGIDPAYLDLPFFYAWAIFCAEEILDGYGGTEARAACNIILDVVTDVMAEARRLASVGRANTYWRGDKFTGWIDNASTVVDLVTMDGIMSKSWKNNWAIEEELAGVAEIMFKDKTQGYERTSADWSRTGGDHTNVVSLEGLGITSRGQAIHYAKFLMTRTDLIKNTNEFKVAKEGFRYNLGDVVRVQSRPSNWGEGYRVVSATGDTITVDRDVVGDISASDTLFIRSYKTATEVVVIDNYVVDSVLGSVITVTVAWDTAPTKGDVVAVGAAASIKLRRIIKITPRRDNYFDVVVETYDTDLFNADSIDPDNPDINYIWPGALPDGTPPVVPADLDALVSQLIPTQHDTDIPSLSNCTFTGSGGDTIAWSVTDGDFPITFRYRGVTYEIDPDSSTDEFIYWDPTATTVFLSTNLNTTATDTGHWPVAVNMDGVAHQAVGFQIIHAGLLLAGTIRAETYLELRNTYVYNGDDSLDIAHPFEIPFKIVSEMIDINSAKLSFRIMPYRAYSTAASAGGAQTSGGGGVGWQQVETEDATALDANTDSSRANMATSARTDMEDLNTHNHTMPQHDHDLSGSTNTDSGGGTHSHNLGFSANVSNEDPGDTNQRDLGSHQHDMPNGTAMFNGHTHGQNEPIGGHKHTMPTQDDHTHDVVDHVHGVNYGLFEEANSPTVHYHIDNGAGYGGASGNFTVHQLDLDISGLLSGTGWKSIRFDTDLRCRIFVIVELKLDINA